MLISYLIIILKYSINYFFYIQFIYIRHVSAIYFNFKYIDKIYIINIVYIYNTFNCKQIL